MAKAKAKHRGEINMICEDCYYVRSFGFEMCEYHRRLKETKEES